MTIGAQLQPVRSRKNPAALPGALPVAGEQPLTRFAGMTLACPVYETLLHEIIVMKSFPESSILHVETALEAAKKAIQLELFRK